MFVLLRHKVRCSVYFLVAAPVTSSKKQKKHFNVSLKKLRFKYQGVSPVRPDTKQTKPKYPPPDLQNNQLSLLFLLMKVKLNHLSLLHF